MWAVVVTFHYGDECYRDELYTDVKLYKTRAEAILKLEGIIRHDWTTEVPARDESETYESLADRPGYPEDDTPKHSECHYSEDKDVAWAFYTDGHGYKGEVIELEVPE